MKSVWILWKLASRILKKHSKLFSILCSWKYASRLSYFQYVYHDCVSESHQKYLRKNGKMKQMNWTEGAMICCCRNIVKNRLYRDLTSFYIAFILLLIVLLCFLGRHRFYTFCLMQSQDGFWTNRNTTWFFLKMSF